MTEQGPPNGFDWMIEQLEADLRAGRRSVRDLTTAELDGLIGHISGVAPEVAHRRRRRALLFITLACVVLVPWIALLATVLPRHYVVSDWRLAWTGFDIAELVMLAITAYLGWRGRMATMYAALITAVLLVCDAWFDVTTSNAQGIWFSVADALIIELPFAFILIRGALNMLRVHESHLERLQPMTLRRVWRAPLLAPPPTRSSDPGAPPGGSSEPAPSSAERSEPGSSSAERSESGSSSAEPSSLG